MKKVNVIGLGYIGLPTALMLASHGVEVVGTDYNKTLLETLKGGRTTFEEKGLDELFHQALRAGIRFSDEYETCGFYIVAVPTPYDPVTKQIDATYVVSAVKTVLEHCEEDAIVVVESTVSPGTMDRFVCPIVAAQGKRVHLVHAPERIIPGNMVYELLHNSRTIGADEPAVAEEVGAVYSTFCQGEIVLTDIRTAEMTKVVENTFRDINIAFANELCKICRRDNMDVNEIIRIANKHPRVNILSPGPGVGGHCISVDPWFLVGDYPEEAKLIHQARLVNDSMPAFVVERIEAIAAEKGITDFSRVGLYGLTYKENVDDTRESPTLQLLEYVQKSGKKMPFCVYDPYVTRDLVEGQVHDFDVFLNAVDFLVILVGHQEIRTSLEKLSGKTVLDTRRVCEDDSVYRL